MAEIIQFPAQTAKLGYKRVRNKRTRDADHPDQLALFAQPTAQILTLAPELSRFEQALILDERGDPQAAQLYEKAIEEQDCAADAYCNLGILESQKGNVTRAFDCFTIALKQDPRHAEAHYNLGNLYFDVNDFRLAQIHYEMAGQVNPSFPNVYFNLGLVLAINNDLANAVQALTRYRALAPESERHNAEELLQNLQKLLSVRRNSRSDGA